MKKYKVGDIYKWQGLKDSDTGEVNCGYLYIVTGITESGVERTGHMIRGVKNRWEAIKKWEENN